MKHSHVALMVAAVALFGHSNRAAADDAVVNTPTIIAALKGEWELHPNAKGDYKQRLHFDGSRCGEWHQSKESLPVSTTFYVEGKELLIQFDYEPNVAFNYRLKQLRFGYKLDAETLTLKREGVTEIWKRIDEPDRK